MVIQVMVRGRSEIFRTNADAQLVHLLNDGEPTQVIAKVRNESPDYLYLVDANNQLKIFNTEYVSEVKCCGWIAT